MSRKVTMQQIADEAGVSRTTVSFILNNTPGKGISAQTRQQVLKVAEALGYVHPGAQHSKAIGFVIRGSAERVAQSMLLLEALRGVSSAVEPLGYHVTLMATGVSTAMNELSSSSRFRGIVFSDLLIDDAEFRRLLQLNIPLISIGDTHLPDVYCVDIDNLHAAFVAVTHLLDLGHRRIAMIAHASPEHEISADRVTGYRRALAAHGLDFNPDYVRHGNFTSETGQQAILNLLDSLPEPPSAVFVAGDVLALGVVSALQNRGMRVPEDMSVVGFDDIPLVRHLNPPLTTVRRHAHKIGEMAGQMLVALIEGDEPPGRRVLIDSELIVRGSTAPYQSANGDQLRR